MSELVQAVKRPRALSESINRPLTRRSGGGGEKERSDAVGRRNSENLGGMRSSMQRINEVPEKKQQKSARHSFMGYRLMSLTVKNVLELVIFSAACI